MKIIKFSESQRQELKEIVSKFNSYSNFSRNKKAAYSYAEIFQVSICPYCNIHYIDTIANISRPEFDHFVPKSSGEGKRLELDPDNIIPSCHVCNATIKRNLKFSINTHIHPFHEDFDSIMCFYINIKKASYLLYDGFDIEFSSISSSPDSTRKAFALIKDLKLYARYQVHKKFVIEILKFIRHYNACHRRQVYELIRMPSYEINTLEALITGYLDSNINNTSLGKLRKDIISAYAD